MEVYENVISMIGKTPIIHHNNIYIKLESYNPTGSIKDRAAFNMLNKAISNKIIKENDTIIEASSGNMGIALAYFCRVLNLKCIITMPSNMSIERVNLMKLYGANVILTNKEEGMLGSIKKAKLLAGENNYIYLDQFSNENNYLAHLETAKEIFSQLDNIDYIISGIGTGGTIRGIAQYIKDNNLKTKVIGVEPEKSAVINNKSVSSHNIPGIGAGFIPPILDLTIVDKVVTVSSENAYLSTKELVNENIMCGISTGAVYYVAKNILSKEPNKKVLIISPDGINKYLSVLNV